MASVRPEDWVKIGEEKLASAATSIRVPASGSFAEYNSLLVLVDAQADGGDQSPALTFNDETTGTKYSTVYTHDSGQTSSITRQNDQAKITNCWQESGGLPCHAHLYILNNAGNEKSVIFNAVNQSTAGSTNFPPLTSGVGKWEETTNRITSLRFTNNSSGTPNFGVGTEVIVFGSHKATNTADKSIITNVPVGSRYEETDTRKIYNMLDTWVTTAGTLSAAVYIPTGRGDKTDGWTTTGVVTGSTYRNELDVWNGTTWSDNGTDINLDLNGSTSAGKVSAGIICAGSSTGSGADDTGCTRFASGSWTTKAVTPVQSGYGFGGGTATNFMHGGGATGNTEIVRCDSWAEDSWTSEGNLPSDGTTDGLAACAGDGTSLSTMFVAGGRAENYADTTSTAESSGSAGSITWSSSPAAFTIASSANVGGGNKTGFWKIGGQPSGSQGKVLYYNGTAWSSKPDTLYAFGGNAGGANNGGTNPIVMGGKVLPVNGSWTTGQYFGSDWSERVTS